MTVEVMLNTIIAHRMVFLCHVIFTIFQVDTIIIRKYLFYELLLKPCLVSLN